MAGGTRGRILALDLGSKRIGVAVSDELQLTAQGLDTLAARPPERVFEVLQDLVRDYNVSEMVVGLPVHMDGSRGESARAVLAFADRLRERLEVAVHLVDERLTSVQAERALLEADVSRARRRQLRDRVSAVLILQGFLDGRSRGD